MDSVNQYFQQMPTERSTPALALHELILAGYPQVQVGLKYKMPTYASEDGWLAIGN